MQLTWLSKLTHGAGWLPVSDDPGAIAVVARTLMRIGVNIHEYLITQKLSTVRRLTDLLTRISYGPNIPGSASAAGL